MNIKNLLLAVLLACSSTSFYAGQPNIDQEQLSAMMSHIYDLMMPDFKKVYKKHFDEIEWLERNYVVNEDKGQEIIIKIAREFTQILTNKINEIIDVAFADTGATLSAEQKAMFAELMLQILPTSMVQSLMKNAELKSSVYQEILAERKK